MFMERHLCMKQRLAEEVEFSRMEMIWLAGRSFDVFIQNHMFLQSDCPWEYLSWFTEGILPHHLLQQCLRFGRTCPAWPAELTSKVSWEPQQIWIKIPCNDDSSLQMQGSTLLTFKSKTSSPMCTTVYMQWAHSQPPISKYADDCTYHPSHVS